jgi:hypothetical protein
VLCAVGLVIQAEPASCSGPRQLYGDGALNFHPFSHQDWDGYLDVLSTYNWVLAM